MDSHRPLNKTLYWDGHCSKMKTFLEEKLCFKADNSLIKMCPRWTLLQDRHTSSKVVTLTKVNTSWCIKRLQIVWCINNVIFLNLSVSLKKKNFSSCAGHQSSKFRIKLWFLRTITLKWTSLAYSLDLGKPAISLSSFKCSAIWFVILLFRFIEHFPACCIGV